MNLPLEHVLRECSETGDFQKCVQFHISWRISHMMNFVCRSNLKNLKFSEIKERESRQRQHFSLCIHPIHITSAILQLQYCIRSTTKLRKCKQRFYDILL